MPPQRNIVFRRVCIAHRLPITFSLQTLISDTKRNADKRVKSLEREACQTSETASTPALVDTGDPGETQATPSLQGEVVSTSPPAPVSMPPQGQTASIPQPPGESVSPCTPASINALTYLEPSAKSKEVRCDICELDYVTILTNFIMHQSLSCQL